MKYPLSLTASTLLVLVSSFSQANAAEDVLTMSAKWMKISGYIIGTAVACGASQDDALPVGNRIIEKTADSTGNNVSRKTLAEIHVRAFLGSVKMQKKVGMKGCDAALEKFARLKSSHS